MSLSSQQNDILALFNLESEDIEDISYANEAELVIIRILLRPDYPPCPDCGNPNVLIKGYVQRPPLPMSGLWQNLLRTQSIRLLFHEDICAYRNKCSERSEESDRNFLFRRKAISHLSDQCGINIRSARSAAKTPTA